MDNLTTLNDLSRDEFSFQPWTGSVVHVDYERMSVVVMNDRTREAVKEITEWPATQSGMESNNVEMPEYGTRCVVMALHSKGGFQKHVIVSWLNCGTDNAIQGIASRPFEGVKKYSTRHRGMYRKAYPGESVRWSPGGYTERLYSGWDQQSMDLSREVEDPLRRTLTTLNGRVLERTDYQMVQEGQVNRQGGPDCFEVVLPDGTKEEVLYLQQTFKPKTDPRERYLSGIQDLIPLTERVHRVMEFSLDYPVPKELWEDEETLDFMLGLTIPEAKWWQRTAIKAVDKLKCDDQTEMITQQWDHPNTGLKEAVGPTREEGITPRRRGWILESSEGTLVGYNKFDKPNYGKVLKPTIFPYNKKGRFNVDAVASYEPIVPYPDHVEVKMASGVWSMRFPYEYNTTRFEITKEGMLLFDIGSSIPRENIKWDPMKYEHPHGAGRSIEGHTTGSVKMVLGKNRDEEESLDLTTIGGTILRLGADDSSLPDFRRNVMTQIRGKKDVVAKRELQWWKEPKLNPGDAGDLEDKKGAENVSLRGAFDGGMFLRLGARDIQAKRRHLINGYKDGPGKERWAPSDGGRKDSRTNGRPCYGAGDSNYKFHDLPKVTDPLLNIEPYANSGDPTFGAVDLMGSSADIHAVRDIFLRVGANEKSNQSLTMDLLGGILMAVGKDKAGRSLSAQLDGGVEATIGMNDQKKGVRLEINGDVDIAIRGHLNLNVTGDITGECSSRIHHSKIKDITRSTSIFRTGLVGNIDEAPTFVRNQGNYSSGE